VTLHARVAELTGEVEPVDERAAAAARERHARLAKPPGSLGGLESIGERLAAIAGACPPPVPRRPAVVVAAGDHGVHARGVSPWPRSITRTMVELICSGRASVNAIAATVGAQVSVLDVGVAGAAVGHPLARRARVRDGTADLAEGPAMTRDEAARALLAGAGIAEELGAAGVDLLVPGDMGIANTTAGACLVAAFTGADPARVTGPGAGADGEALDRKREIVVGAVERHRAAPASGPGPGGQGDPGDALGTLAALGGLEHAALAGVILSGAADRRPIVLDGLAACAAALAATALCPAAAGYLFAGHRSTEPGAAVALGHLGLDPLLDLDLRLGEGTGGLLAVPLVVAGARVLGEVATIDEVLASGSAG
jgi:nicotinate-nucleotide--dimethylbenzimidazole phosphoribosyltransferase